MRFLPLFNDVGVGRSRERPQRVSLAERRESLRVVSSIDAGAPNERRALLRASNSTG